MNDKQHCCHKWHTIAKKLLGNMTPILVCSYMYVLKQCMLLLLERIISNWYQFSY